MSGGTTGDDTKKAVCKAFTGVVRGSALPLDPKAFFMMLTTSYAILVRDRRIDLGPLWDAMAADHPRDILYGVFLMFRLKAMDLGLKVLLPAAVDSLSEDEMRAAMAPWTGMMVPDEPTPSMPIPLATEDLRPIIADETRRKVVQIVSSAIRNSPVGSKLDAAKITFRIDSAFDSLFDGTTFDFAQIFEELRRTEPLEDIDVYWAVARAKLELTPLNLGVTEPQVSLNSIEKQNIVDEIRRLDQKRTLTSSDILEKPADAEPSKRLTKEEKLKEYGLDSVRENVRSPLLVRLMLAGFVVMAGVAWFLTRPDRSLSHDQYLAVMPVKSAELVSDTFTCIVDEDEWFKHSVEDRAARLGKFEAILAAEGYVPNMQCRTTKGDLVITAAGTNNKIVGASAFMKGTAMVRPTATPVAESKE